MPATKLWAYDIEEDASRGGTTDVWTAGKVVGGGSSVNAMLWVRGNRADYDGWARQGAEGWDYDALLPYFRALERYEGGEDRWRGGRGPQSVSHIRMAHPMAANWLAGADEAGVRTLDDYNGESQHGSGWAQLTQRRGIRRGTGRSFLARARRRSGLRLVTHAHVRRVLFEGDRAVGVEYEVRGVVRQVRAEREVVLSGGALETPAILMRSGIGDADALRALGIPVVADVPGVGRNLQEHPTFSMAFDVTVRTLNQELTPVGFVRHGLDFALFGRGPATTGPTHATSFERLDGDDGNGGAPTYQVMFVPLAFADDKPPSASQDPVHDKQNVQMATTSKVTTFVALLHPRSRGSVTLRSADPDTAPAIAFPFLGHPDDVRDLANAARRVRDMFSTRAMKPYVVGESGATASLQTDEDWEEFLRAHVYGASHWVGTARMGRADDPDAVVDPRLRVRGVRGLRVADASVMPTITSGNTNAPSILIGEKGASLLLEDLSSTVPTSPNTRKTTTHR